MSAKKTKLKYIGTNFSYTAERIRFDRDNIVHEVDSKLAKYLLKTGYFEEVESNNEKSAKENTEAPENQGTEENEDISTALD